MQCLLLHFTIIPIVVYCRISAMSIILAMSTKSTDIVLAVVHVFFCPERHDNIIGYVCVTISEYFSLYKGGLSLILCYSMIVTSISIQLKLILLYLNITNHIPSMVNYYISTDIFLFITLVLL